MAPVVAAQVKVMTALPPFAASPVGADNAGAGATGVAGTAAELALEPAAFEADTT